MPRTPFLTRLSSSSRLSIGGDLCDRQSELTRALQPASTQVARSD